MKKLIEVLELIAEKYISECDVIIEENTLTIEYYTYQYREKDIFKTLQITEFEGALKVNFVIEKVTKIIELDELNNIFNILKHQEQYRKPSEDDLEQIIKQYPRGTKIKIDKLFDFKNDIPAGAIGIVKGVTENRTLQVVLEDGTVAEIFVGRDKFNKI